MMYFARFKKHYMENPEGKKLAEFKAEEVSIGGRNGFVQINFENDMGDVWHTVGMNKTEAITLLHQLYEYLEPDIEEAIKEAV